MMERSGFYYLHTEGALIFKRFDEQRERDLIESPFVSCYWPFDSGNRAHAWQIVICATVAGVHPDRVRVLREMWGCAEEDADKFAEYLGITLGEDQGMMRAVRLATPMSDEKVIVGSGKTKFEALVDLAKAVGWKPNKDSLSFLELAGRG